MISSALNMLHRSSRIEQEISFEATPNATWNDLVASVPAVVLNSRHRTLELYNNPSHSVKRPVPRLVWVKDDKRSSRTTTRSVPFLPLAIITPSSRKSISFYDTAMQADVPVCAFCVSPETLRASLLATPTPGPARDGS